VKIDSTIHHQLLRREQERHKYRFVLPPPPYSSISPLIFARQLCGKMKFQKLDVYINKCICWARGKGISLRAVIRGRA
jgi:hypothetical protein